MFSTPGTPVSSTNKTDRHDIAEILLKMTLYIITLTLTQVCSVIPMCLFVCHNPEQNT